MSDEPRNHARIVHVTEAELRAELASLLEQVKDCSVGYAECPCHGAMWDQIDTTRFLLGPSDPDWDR